MASGPLVGLKVIELGGFGPTHFCGMMLSDMGADVIRIERPDARRIEGFTGSRFQFDSRGRRSVALDLKLDEDVETCLRLVEKADIVTEGYRPGVAERLGVGPDEALGRNPRIIYGRLTGYGQTGPYSQRVGHDPNFLALSGMLHLIGTREKPVMPLVLVANYGGAIAHVAGLLAALLASRENGRGQVVDTSLAETSAYMGTIVFAMISAGMWVDERESNYLDGGAPFAGNYQCRDGRWVTLGASEPKHWKLLLRKLDLEDLLDVDYRDHSNFENLRQGLAERFLTKTQVEWCEVMGEEETCFAPILTPKEAFVDPHNIFRGTFVELDGAIQPAPAPKFSRTPSRVQGPPPAPGQHTKSVLKEWLG